MLITYYEDGKVVRRGITPILVLLIMANLAISAVILFAWTYIAFFVAEPLSWATWLPVTRGNDLMGVFDYPFIILWNLPLIGAYGAWIGEKGGRKTMAYAFVAVPLIMASLVFGWYYLAPPDWR